MGRTTAIAVPVLFLSLSLFVSQGPVSSELDTLPEVASNDNRQPAGMLADGVLELQLEVQTGLWHLLGDGQPGVEILAFAEHGKSPEIPGPLIRVPHGTVVHVTVTNPLDTALVVHGFGERSGAPMDSLLVPPQATRDVRFTADVEGTYFYWGTTTGAPLDERAFEDSQLHGAFIVDPMSTDEISDRVMVIGLFTDTKLPDGEPDVWREFLTINGRPWPYTERLTYDMGDSIRWRLINTTVAPHPMHLHGFYYRVDARGDIARDTIYWQQQQRMAVTERLEPGTTMSMVWSPNRPGGWIFHCHISFHVIPNPRLGPERNDRAQRIQEVVFGKGEHGDPDHHVENGMGGLMMAMYVRPPEGWEPNEPKRTQHRLFVNSDSIPGAQLPSFAYVLQEGSEEPAPDSLRIPGSTIVTWKGEPTSIWVINRSHQPTQVHWHGLEIESYFDGVAGVGGYPNRLTPAIAPNDSFEMRITPPRAGSFMYHTHINDVRQQGTGLYGAFVVLEEGEAWNPDTDRVLLIGNAPRGESLAPALNGATELPPTEFKVGTTYRLRLMNITLGSARARVKLLKDGDQVMWLPVAKDGFDMPLAQRLQTRSEQMVSVGETFDFEYTPSEAGEMRIEVRSPDGELFAHQVVTVVE
jgi:FtsP/CotA-like multicopper oxidase with cupredoxin domain